MDTVSVARSQDNAEYEKWSMFGSLVNMITVGGFTAGIVA